MNTAKAAGIMVTRQFTQGLAWLHARVGRRTPIPRGRGSDRHPLLEARLRATVYLPSPSERPATSLG